MNYKDAMERIQKIHLHVWGCFFKDLPKLAELTQPEAQAVLLERANEMKKLMDDNQVSWLELSRFYQEFEVVCLLLLLCALGKFSEEIPITEEDIGNVQHAVSDLCAAGWAEEGQGVIDTARKVLTEGMKSREFPSVITLLLTNGT
jgi:hypothetical protein